MLHQLLHAMTGGNGGINGNNTIATILHISLKYQLCGAWKVLKISGKIIQKICVLHLVRILFSINYESFPQMTTAMFGSFYYVKPGNEVLCLWCQRAAHTQMLNIQNSLTDMARHVLKRFLKAGKKRTSRETIGLEVFTLPLNTVRLPQKGWPWQNSLHLSLSKHTFLAC